MIDPDDRAAVRLACLRLHRIFHVVLHLLLNQSAGMARRLNSFAGRH
jgi:ribosomal protein L30/L7E